MQNKLILSILIAAVVFGGGGFYGGMQYTKSKIPTVAGRFPGGQNGGNFRIGQNGASGGAGQARFGGGASGEVVSKDATSLTLKLMDGGSKIVFLSTSTTVNKMAEGALDDILPGTNISIIGTPNQDGSVTASQIQIRPNLPVRPTR